MEIRSNRTALGDFWRTVNALGVKGSLADGTPIPADSVKHLADMYANGLISYTLPAWSTVRWEALEPRTVASLQPARYMLWTACTARSPMSATSTAA
jgi:hypothetical protein